MTNTKTIAERRAIAEAIIANGLTWGYEPARLNLWIGEKSEAVRIYVVSSTGLDLGYISVDPSGNLLIDGFRAGSGSAKEQARNRAAMIAALKDARTAAGLTETKVRA